jgi:hypothetical protein
LKVLQPKYSDTLAPLPMVRGVRLLISLMAHKRPWFPVVLICLLRMILVISDQTGLEKKPIVRIKLSA